MNLEPLIQRLEADSTQFRAEMEKARDELLRTGAVSEQTATTLAESYLKAATQARASGNTIERSAGQVGSAFGGMARTSRFALQNVAFQLQDIIVQLQAGQRASIVFAQQGSQIAGAFGPAGAAIGVAIALVGALGGSLLGLGRSSRDAEQDLDKVLTSIKAIGDQEGQIKKVGDAIKGLDQAGRVLAGLELKVDTKDAEKNLEAAKAAIQALVETIQAVNQAQAQGFAGRIDLGPGEQLITQLAAIRRAFEAGDAAAGDVAERILGISQTAVSAMPEVATATQAAFHEVQQFQQQLAVDPESIVARQGILDALDRLTADIRQRQAAAAAAFAQAAPVPPELIANLRTLAAGFQTGTVGAEQVAKAIDAIGEAAKDSFPEFSRRALDAAKQVRALEGEVKALQSGLALTRGAPRAAPLPTVQAKDVAAVAVPLERQADLLRQIGGQHELISAIIKLEEGGTRALTTVERERLASAVTTLQVIQQGLTLATQEAQLRAQIAAGGRDTAESRVQQQLAAIKATQGPAVASQLEPAIRQAERLKDVLAGVKFGAGLSDELAQIQLATQYAGRESEEYRVQLALLQAKRRLGRDLTADQREQVAAIERQRAALEGAQTHAGLGDQIEQLRLVAQFAGQETEEFRVQNQLLELKLRLHGQDVSAYEAEVRQIQQLITLQQQQAADRQLRGEAAATRQRITAGTNPADVFSRTFGAGETVETRVAARETQLRGQGVSPEEIARRHEEVVEVEKLNQQLELQDNLQSALSDSAAQLGETLLFSGAQDAGQQLIQMLIRLQFQLVANLLVAAALKAAFSSFGGGAGAGAATTFGATGTAGGFGGTFAGGGHARKGVRIKAAEAGEELWVPDALAAGGSVQQVVALAAALGMPQADARRITSTSGGRALLGMVAGGGEPMVAAPRGVQVLGRRGPQLFVPPEDGTVIPNADLRAIEALPGGRDLLRSVGRAGGGGVRAGESVVVGEDGEELWLPKRGRPRPLGRLGAELFRADAPGEVVPHADLLRMGGMPRFLAAGTVDTTALLGQRAAQPPNVKFEVIDQRQANSPPVETTTRTAPDGTLIATAMVRAGLSEMHRTGEMQEYMRRGFNVRPAGT